MNTPHDHDHDHEHDHEPQDAPKMPELSEDQKKAIGDFFTKLFSPNGLRITAVSLAAVATVGTVLFALAHKDGAELKTIAKPSKDINWLMNSDPNFERSHEQFTLFLGNEDLTKGDVGIIQQNLAREAWRFRALAVIRQQTPGSPCYKQQDVFPCYKEIALNLKREYQEKPGASGNLFVAIEMKALDIAVTGGSQIPDYQDNTAIFSLSVDRWIQDIELAKSNTLNGKIKQQQQADLDMKNGASPGGNQ